MEWGHSITGNMRTRRRVGAGVRRALVHLLLLTFFAQGVVVQSHFHANWGAAQSQSDIAKKAEKAGVFDIAAKDQKKSPAAPSHNEDGCPLCVQAAFAGTFVGNGPNAIAPPIAVASPVYFSDAPRLGGRLVALGWQSRAPPSA